MMNNAPETSLFPEMTLCKALETEMFVTILLLGHSQSSAALDFKDPFHTYTSKNMNIHVLAFFPPHSVDRSSHNFFSRRLLSFGKIVLLLLEPTNDDGLKDIYIRGSSLVFTVSRKMRKEGSKGQRGCFKTLFIPTISPFYFCTKYCEQSTQEIHPMARNHPNSPPQLKISANSHLHDAHAARWRTHNHPPCCRVSPAA